MIPRALYSTAFASIVVVFSQRMAQRVLQSSMVQRVAYDCMQDAGYACVLMYRKRASCQQGDLGGAVSVFVWDMSHENYVTLACDVHGELQHVWDMRQTNLSRAARGRLIALFPPTTPPPPRVPFCMDPLASPHCVKDAFGTVGGVEDDVVYITSSSDESIEQLSSALGHPMLHDKNDDVKDASATKCAYGEGTSGGDDGYDAIRRLLKVPSPYKRQKMTLDVTQLIPQMSDGFWKTDDLVFYADEMLFKTFADASAAGGTSGGCTSGAFAEGTVCTTTSMVSKSVSLLQQMQSYVQTDLTTATFWTQ